MSAPQPPVIVPGPELVQDVTVHEDGTVEAVTVKPMHVFVRRPDGSLEELFGEVAARTLEEFWGTSC